MALDKSAIADLLDALRAGGDLDIIGEGLAEVRQALIDAEATEVIGADRYSVSRSRYAATASTRPIRSSRATVTRATMAGSSPGGPAPSGCRRRRGRGGRHPIDVAAAGGAVWVSVADPGTVLRIAGR